MIKAFNVLLILLSTAAIFSCGGKKQEVAIEEKPVAVTIETASVSNISLSKTYTGTLEGWRQAKIYASIPEAVVELPFQEGNAVEAGQAVIILDKEGPASQLQQARAVYQDAKDNFEKMSRLFEQGAISEQTYNNLRTNLDVARANYEAARQQVELTSPISGILTDLAVNIGQYAPLGSPLATVAQTSKLRLTLYVDSRSASFLKVGQRAEITVESLESLNSSVEGVVTEVARSADPETRLFRVELQIDNSQRKLSPGMFARANIVVEELRNILLIPREAVFSTEGIAKVFTLDGDRARERSISIGEGNNEYYHVISGIKEGESVIVLGRNHVSEGTLVKVVEGQGATVVAEESKES